MAVDDDRDEWLRRIGGGERGGHELRQLVERIRTDHDPVEADVVEWTVATVQADRRTNGVEVGRIEMPSRPTMTETQREH